jgi:hypothetical protein
VREINIYSYRTKNNDYVRNKTKSFHGFVDRNNNSFSSLLDYNTKSYKWNNYGHIECDYISSIIKYPKQNRKEDVLTKHREEYTRVWESNQEEANKEECGLVLYANNKGNQ